MIDKRFFNLNGKGKKVLRLKGRCLAILFSLVSLGATASEDKKLNIAIDDYCPYTCLTYKHKGIFVELVEAILIPRGYKLIYHNRPWRRAMLELSVGQVDLLLAVNSYVSQDYIYPKEVFFRDDFCFFGLEGKDWRFSGVESLRGKKLALLAFESEVPEYGLLYPIVSNLNSINLTYVVPNEENLMFRVIQMIYSGRVELVPVDVSILKFYKSYYKKMGSHKELKNYGCFEDKNLLTVALSPVNKSSKEVAVLLSEGLIELKKSGKYNEILLKYNIHQ